jgi:hypothetical protein
MSQVFKQIYPIDDFLNFIKEFSDDLGSYFLFSKSSFKKIKLNNKVSSFFEDVKPYYHKSKQFYANRKPLYKNFITILKQICKINNIPYDSSIIYSKSTYELKYKIYYKFEITK